VDARRSQVKDGSILLQSLMREKRSEAVRAYRCLVMFSVMDDSQTGGITTVDLSPARFTSLERLDHDPDARRALAQVFSLATAGISMVSKR
jgi:hypothetical protein